jgi:tetratricopeptide (TPR) repeat protein
MSLSVSVPLKDSCLIELQQEDCYNDFISSFSFNDLDSLSEARLRRAEAYLMKGQYDEALNDIDEIIKLDPNNAFAYFRCGDYFRMYDLFDKAIINYNEALCDLNEAIDLNPSESILHAIAVLYKTIGQRKTAIIYLEKAVDLNPNLEWAKLNCRKYGDIKRESHRDKIFTLTIR